MTFVSCSIPEQCVNPLFEVFDGGDFVLSSYHDVEADSTCVRIFLEDPSRASAAKACLSAALELVGVSAPVEVGELPDEDWQLAYRRHFRIEEIGRRLVTVPAWERVPAGSRVPIVLDPGMAFGTGRHETTRACLEYIDELADSPDLGSFLDMGCGSGILGIAAAKLGFAPVAGFDIDEAAVRAARENAAKNGVQVDFREFALGKGAVSLAASIEAAKGLYPDLALQGRGAATPTAHFEPAELVVANILGPLLVAFADEIAGYAKRRLIVSGILSELYPEVLAAFEARGFREESRKTLGEWTTGLLTRTRRF
ncbi:MAG: 50S ribosomal protein L11 methyltransferase [Kiritimatiellia bacterium]